MSYWQQLKNFDPLVGVVPQSPIRGLDGILWRARRLLRNRDSDQIHDTATRIDEVIEEFYKQEIQNFVDYQVENDGWARVYLLEAQSEGENLERYVEDELPLHAGPDDELDYLGRDSTDELEALKECIDFYYLQDLCGFPEPEEYECFAVLGLWMLADAIEWLRGKNFQAGDRLLELPSSISISADYALKAMDAVCYAEHLFGTSSHYSTIDDLNNELYEAKKDKRKSVERLVKQRRSDQSRKAASIRHKETTEMRLEAIQYYEEHKDTFTSIEDAARYISLKVVPLTPRTIAKWISSYRKIRSASKE